MLAWWTLLSQLACVTGPAQQPPASKRARFVPGEIVVKFRSGSEGARLVTGPGAATDLRATLSPYTDRLSREIGLPVEAQRALSGGEVLLAIGLPALTNRLLAEAMKERSLEGARVQEGALKTGGRNLSAVRVHLTKTGTDDKAAVTKRLAERLGFKVESRADNEGLLLFVDSEAVTLRALGVLMGRPEVEYAQLNYILGKVGSS
jgi:hypothetical protein